MERLQEAMSRARARREGASATPEGSPPPAQPERPPSAPRARPAQDSSGAWASLAKYEPNERTLRSNRIVSFFGGRQAAPFDMMRTKIIKQITGNNWKRLVVTSPKPQCGKTTIVTNLAFSLARYTEMKVLVVEVDMRRPELAKILGIRENLGFARYLSGEDSSPIPHMVAYGGNLAFAANSIPAANPSELLHSAQARKQLEALEAEFTPDVVLFDAPPVLMSDDTLAFIDYADAAMIVAAAEQTSVSEVDIVEREIAAATNVMGVVMNKTRYMPENESYDGAYY